MPIKRRRKNTLSRLKSHHFSSSTMSTKIYFHFFSRSLMPQREDEEEDSEANRARWFVRSGLEEKVYITARLDHRWHIQMCFFISTSLRAVEERKRDQHINYIRFWHEQILKSDFIVEPFGFFYHLLFENQYICLFLDEGKCGMKVIINIHTLRNKKRTNN